MNAYNAATVIRLTSRPILSAFFKHEGCLQQIDFNKAGLHEIQEAYGALPEQIRSRIEPILRNVFIFSHGKLSMISLIDEIKKYHNTDDRDIIFAFCSQKNRYDQAFFIYMNYPDIWEKACYFVSVDMLPKRFWTRINGLPRRDPKTDAAALQDFGRLVSDYYMKTQMTGMGRIYELTGEKKYRDIAEFFYDRVANYGIDSGSGEVRFTSSSRAVSCGPVMTRPPTVMEPSMRRLTVMVRGSCLTTGRPFGASARRTLSSCKSLSSVAVTMKKMMSRKTMSIMLEIGTEAASSVMGLDFLDICDAPLSGIHRCGHCSLTSESFSVLISS